MSDVPLAVAVGRVLRAAGVGACYGAPFGRLDVVPVASATVAALLGSAHCRVHGERVAVHRGGGTFDVYDPLAGAGDLLEVDIDDADALVAAFASGALGGGAATGSHGGPPLRLHLPADPDTPVPDQVPEPSPRDRWGQPDEAALDALAAAGAVAVLAGPGVVTHGAVSGLHDLAAGAGLGVLNTWGAKGVFDWRSRHHLATVGLQELDFALGGLAEAELILATGLDPFESPDDRWQLAPSVVVHPDALSATAEGWSGSGSSPASRRDIDIPPLRARLADVTQQGWAASGPLLAPSRVTMHYARCVGGGGLLAADPGTAGFWVARTFATTLLGSAVVPGRTGVDGFAAACVAVARLRRPGMPALAVVDAPVHPDVVAVVDAAATLGVTVPVEVWDPDGDRLGADDHATRVHAASFAGLGGLLSLATDPAWMGRIVDAAGPVVAWTPTAPRSASTPAPTVTG